MAHAPFIANASPELFGEESFNRLPHLRDLKSLFDGPQYIRWQAFRKSEDSRYVGLCLPRFLLRLPYKEISAPIKAFNFNEDSFQRDHYLWGHASHALVTRIADSFAKYRWCLHIVGPNAGGLVEHDIGDEYSALKGIQKKITTEILVTSHKEFELSEEGFIPLAFHAPTDGTCFFSANSVQKPKKFGNSVNGKQLETDYRLSTQLPYIFLISRLAHYIKVLQREQIGAWKERSDLERELNNWISQYVSDMDDPEPKVRAIRPLRKAQIIVENIEGQPGWYRCHMKIRPHFKFMGTSFTLSLMGRLDRG
jgi:type VI secretion system protein ImpC